MEETIKLIIINNNVKNKDGIMDCMFASVDKDNLFEIEISKDEVDKLTQYYVTGDIDKLYHFRYLYEYLKKHNPLEFNMMRLDKLGINYDDSNVPLLTKLSCILAHNGNIVILNSDNFTIVRAPIDHITSKQYESLKSLENIFINKNTALDGVKIEKGETKITKFRGNYNEVVSEYVSTLRNDYGKVK